MTINYNVTIVTTTPYNILDTDEVIFVDVPTDSSIVLPIPAAGKNTAYRIKDYGGHSGATPIIVTAAGGATINGVSFAILNVNYSHMHVVWSGTNWQTY